MLYSFLIEIMHNFALIFFYMAHLKQYVFPLANKLSTSRREDYQG
jgi:hypothetical protein